METDRLNGSHLDHHCTITRKHLAMSQVLDRYQKFSGHLPSVIPTFFVCAECGSTVVAKWHDKGVLIECSKDKAHVGLGKPVPQTLEDNQADELLQFASNDSQVKQAMKEHRKQVIRQLFGEE